LILAIAQAILLYKVHNQQFYIYYEKHKTEKNYQAFLYYDSISFHISCCSQIWKKKEFYHLFKKNTFYKKKNILCIFNYEQFCDHSLYFYLPSIIYLL